jgi:methylase of polypeptide subunit release factors
VSTGDTFAGQTVEAARRTLASRFNAEGIDSAALDARILIGAALKLDLTGLIASAARLLGPGGALVVEAGRGQSFDIEGLMTAAGLTLAGPPRADLAGILRAVAARKLPS